MGKYEPHPEHKKWVEKLAVDEDGDKVYSIVKEARHFIQWGFKERNARDIPRHTREALRESIRANVYTVKYIEAYDCNRY